MNAMKKYLPWTFRILISALFLLSVIAKAYPIWSFEKQLVDLIKSPSHDYRAEIELRTQIIELKNKHLKHFQEMYDRAILLIKRGKAFVCDLTADEIREYRGDFTTPGTESPYRNRSIEENLKLLKNFNKKFPKDFKSDACKTSIAYIFFAYQKNLSLRLRYAIDQFYPVCYMTPIASLQSHCIIM